VILTLDRGEWSDSWLSCISPGDIVPSTHWIVGWVVLRISLDALEKREILALLVI
jgi:hypothetical protein